MGTRGCCVFAPSRCESQHGDPQILIGNWVARAYEAGTRLPRLAAGAGSLCADTTSSCTFLEPARRFYFIHFPGLSLSSSLCRRNECDHTSLCLVSMFPQS